MAYYDRLVENPEAALKKAAERRGDSRESMAARLEAIRGAGSGRGHITLSQAQRYFDENTPPPEDLVAHVNDCDYCTALLNGLETTAIEEGLAAALGRINEDRPRAARGAAELAIPIGAEGLAAVPAQTRSRSAGLLVGGALVATAVGAFFIGTWVTDGQDQAELPSVAATHAEDAVDPERYRALIRDYNALQVELARRQNTAQTFEAARLESLDPSPQSGFWNASEWIVVDADSATVTLERSNAVAEVASLPEPGDNVFVMRTVAAEEDDMSIGVEPAEVSEPPR